MNREGAGTNHPGGDPVKYVLLMLSENGDDIAPSKSRAL